MEYENNFLQTCFGISMVILAAGFFVRSFSPAKAGPVAIPEHMTAGKFQVAIVQSTGSIKLVMWSTETGASKLYNILDIPSMGPMSQLPLFPLDH
jgi:hypothetical protein